MDDTRAALQMADHLLQISGLPNEEITAEDMEIFDKLTEEVGNDAEAFTTLLAQVYLAGLLVARQSEENSDIPITLSAEGAAAFVRGLYTDGITLKLSVQD